MNLLMRPNPDQIITFLSTLFVFLFCLPVHEYSHGRVAYALGDDTAKREGRLTLNPLAHTDPLGLICLVLFRFGWAKPVPINTSKFKNPRLGRVLVSIAGPLSNFIMGFLCFVIAVLTNRVQPGISFFFLQVGTTNIWLGLFNLLPFLPFDGGQIVTAILPNEVYYKVASFMQKYRGIFTVALLVLLQFNVLLRPLYRLLNIVSNLFLSGAVHLLSPLLGI